MGAAKKAAKAHLRRWLIVALLVLLVATVLLVLMVALVTGVPSAGDVAHLDDLEGFVTEEQMERLDDLMVGVERPNDIPLLHFAMYLLAADQYELDWAVLAGIGKAECDHGRSRLEGCNPPGSVNGAGARGPMQFLGSTWRADADQREPDVDGPPVPAGDEDEGYATDGNGDGTADPWVESDAIHAAARYLAHNGAPDDYDQAIQAYNHSDAYVIEVQRWADIYRAEAAVDPPSSTSGDASVEVVQVSCANGQTMTVATTIADSVQRLLDDAVADGVALCGWGYRTTTEQIALRREHCGTSDYAVYEMPASQCRPPTARPGSSMHELGLAVDFSDCSSQSDPCWQWLNTRAAAYGLYNLPSEPWHWSTDGS
jgi:D-alanyl-D-alanine carboxypeptidase-like protein